MLQILTSPPGDNYVLDVWNRLRTIVFEDIFDALWSIYELENLVNARWMPTTSILWIMYMLCTLV